MSTRSSRQETVLGATQATWVNKETSDTSKLRRKHLEFEIQAPHQTCCTSAVVDTSTQHQSTVMEGQLALVLQCEVSDYWPDQQDDRHVSSSSQPQEEWGECFLCRDTLSLEQNSIRHIQHYSNIQSLTIRELVVKCSGSCQLPAHTLSCMHDAHWHKVNPWVCSPWYVQVSTRNSNWILHSAALRCMLVEHCLSKSAAVDECSIRNRVWQVHLMKQSHR